MRTVLALALAASVAAPEVAPAKDWLEVAARPRDAAEAGALAALGWEAKEAEDGATLVYLPVTALPRLASTGIPFTVVEADLEDRYRTRLAPPKIGRGSMGGYFTWSEAVAEMDALATAYPALVAPKVALGLTHEGRPIWAWKLSANAAIDEPEPAALFVALMHAREPVGMMSLLHFAERLLQDHGIDPEATWLLDHREIWIVPVLNADGYTWNEAQSPGGGGMWRKNRRDNGDGTRGVDPNRNFSYEWAHDDAGSSPDPVSDTYRGPGPLSEPETLALRDFLVAHAPAVAVNTHAWGDLLLRPWGYADATCGDEVVMSDMSEIAIRGTAYKPGNGMATVGYLANGEHDDYMWGETTDKPRAFGFTPELGNRNDGFWPSTARIDPICRETWPMNAFFAWVAGSAPRLDSFTVDDAIPGGDGDGFPEPGETVSIAIVVRNHGLDATSGALSATLDAADCAVSVEESESDHGVVASRASASNSSDPFVLRIAASATPGDLARLRLVLSDASGDYPAGELSFLLGEPVTLFSEDFEGGLGAWNPTPFGIEPAGASRPGQALSDSVGGAHGRDANEFASPSGSFDLSGFGRAWLVFEQSFWIDNDFDAASLEISQGGSAWTPVSGETSDIGSGVGTQSAGEPVWDGRRLDWETERVDLSSFAAPGSSVSFRLRFRSNGSWSYDGWHVDDVRLIGFPAASVLPPAEPLLFVAKAGDDLALTWSAPPVDPAHSAADAYTLHRSSSVRGNGGFVPLATTLGIAALDAGMIAAPASYSYTVVATNCAGESSVPVR